MNRSAPSPLPSPRTQPEKAAAGPGGKVWKCGTLTYTFGGLAALFLWLLFGDFAWSMRDRSVGPMSNWYLSHLGVSNLVFSLLLTSLPTLMGLILAPVVSVKSDRYRSRWGRRIPFLVVTTPAAAAGIIGIALTPLISRWVHGHFPRESEMAVSVICFGVFWAAFEFATIASQAVFGGLLNDVVPRELLGRFQGLFRAVSLIDGMIFNFWIMGKVPKHFTLILLVIGVFYGSCFLWVSLKVKEGDYPPPPPPDPNRKGPARRFFQEVRLYCRQCFTNPYYIFVFIFTTVADLTFFPVNVFSIRYAESLGMSMEQFGHILALTYLISLILSYFLGWLADLLHPLRMGMITLVGYAVVTGWGGFCATSVRGFEVAWLLHGVLSGCYFTASASLGQRLFPHERYAQFSSAATLFKGPLTIVLVPLAGTVLDATGNIYRYTFTAGCLLACLALAAGLVVHARFVKLGGSRHYVAPE